MNYCEHCRTARELSELLLVRNYRSGRVRFVCRSNVGAGCFASIGPAAAESIAAADPIAERVGFAAWPVPPPPFTSPPEGALR